MSGEKIQALIDGANALDELGAHDHARAVRRNIRRSMGITEETERQLIDDLVADTIQRHPDLLRSLVVKALADLQVNLPDLAKETPR